MPMSRTMCRRCAVAPSEPLESTARRYIADPEQIWPGLRVGTFLGALGLLVRMAFARADGLDAWEATRASPRISDGKLAHENPDWVRAVSQRRLVLQPDHS